MHNSIPSCCNLATILNNIKGDLRSFPKARPFFYMSLALCCPYKLCHFLLGILDAMNSKLKNYKSAK